MKMPARSSAFSFIRWLLPGLGIKRWLLVALLGAGIFVNGAYRWLIAEGLKFPFNEYVDDVFDDVMPLTWLPWIFMVLGIVLFVIGFRQWMNSIVVALAPAERKDSIVDALLDMRLRRGYRIVAIGGGTGLSTLLRGLKRYTSNITAVVTVSDDGGSSGRLQKELGILPPGDIRNCLVALADDEALVTDLFQYRFQEGEGLTGHSFGNLFLAAMTGITGDFDEAIRESSRVLNIKGRVLPATLESVHLTATLIDGSTLNGETTISHTTTPIKSISLDKPDAKPLGEVISAIRDADAIVLGPGSLFTSILPNLLVRAITEEIAASRVPKIYVCNVMTQPGETDGFSASKHVRVLLDQAGARVCDIAVINNEAPRRLLERYALEGQTPVEPDVDQVEKLGVRVVRANVISETDTVRHDPLKLSDVVVRIIDQATAQRASFVKPQAQPVTPAAQT
jgi:uncharacterized cofD-like protein